MSIQENHMFENINDPTENKSFNEVFTIGKEYPNLAAARQEALSFGKKINVLFVTANSSTVRQSLLLRCKHGNKPRIQKKVEGGEEKKRYCKDTQRFNCPCFIKYGKSPFGMIVIRALHGGHNHPIPKKPTTYAMYRKQSDEVMNLIHKTLVLSSANPVETVMQVLEDKGIKNVIKKDITNIYYLMKKNISDINDMKQS